MLRLWTVDDQHEGSLDRTPSCTFNSEGKGSFALNFIMLLLPVEEGSCNGAERTSNSTDLDLYSTDLYTI